MLNLLPVEKKNIIKKEYRRRKAVLALIFCLALLVILMIFLLPTYILTYLRFEQADSNNSNLKQIIDSQKDKETNFSPKQKEMLGVLQNGQNTLYPPTSLLDAIISKKSSSIVLNDFLIKNKDDEEAISTTISIKGTSQTRENLIEFKQSLQEDKLWSTVNLPISDLGPATNNDFTITLIVAPKI